MHPINSISRITLYNRIYQYIQTMSEENTQMSSQQTQFCISQLVWAKITGYPWWPAQISQISQQDEIRYQVSFVADQTYACLPVSKILPYAEGRKKENFYQKINNALHQAIHIADEKYERQMKLLPLGSQLLRSEHQQTQQQIYLIDKNKEIETEEKIDTTFKKNSSSKPTYAQKKQYIRYKEQKIHELLTKYNLLSIPVLSTKKKPIFPIKKHKKIVKCHKSSEQSMIARKIYKLLREKQVDMQYSQKLATLITKKLKQQNLQQKLQSLTNILKWLNINQIAILEDPEKHENLFINLYKKSALDQKSINE